MEWQWYHYVACIAFGVLMKMVRSALGLTPRRASVYTRAPHGSTVVHSVTEVKQD